jgi:hypothetical protein
MPLRPQLRTKHAKVVVFIALIMSVVFAWPALLLYGTQTIPIPVPGKLHICIIGTINGNSRQNKRRPIVHHKRDVTEEFTDRAVIKHNDV